MKHKICVVTTSRADYGLLYPLLRRMEQSERLALQLLVTGTHFSERYGNTWSEIAADGFTITERIDTSALPSGTPACVAGAILAQCEPVLARLLPKAVVVLGDRFEVLAAATAAHLNGIPVIHISGGEITAGAFDDAIRHAITKIAVLHFTSTEAFRLRVVQMGEAPANVINSGALGIDNIKTTELRSRAELETALDASFPSPLGLVTFHPETLASLPSTEMLSELLEGLEQFPEMTLVFTSPNSDEGTGPLIGMIEDFCRPRPRCRFFKSLGRVNYLSMAKLADVVIGNSSSGITEAPFLGTPTVNIGERQKGRITGPSILSVPCAADSIRQAIRTTLSPKWRDSLPAEAHLYGDGTAAEQMVKTIEQRIEGLSSRKEFYDLPIGSLQEAVQATGKQHT